MDQNAPSSRVKDDLDQLRDENMNLDHIERAKAQWQFIADAIPLLLCLIDRSGRIIRTNRTLERWGLGDVSTIKGASLHGTLHPECMTADCYLSDFESQILSSPKKRAEVEAYDPFLERHVAIKFQPTLSDGLRPDLEEVLAIVSVDDISDTKRAEMHISEIQNGLRERVVQEMGKRIEMEGLQSRLLNILSKTPNFIATAAPDGTLLYLNQSGRNMLQLEETSTGKLCIFDFLTPKARGKMVSQALPAALCNGVWTGYSELLDRHGQVVPTTQIVVAHRNTDGEFEGFSVVEQDMSAWIQSEAALRSSQEESRQLAAQLLNVQEYERQRIAADLHDVIGQSLSLIKLSIDNAAQMIRDGTAEVAGDVLTDLSARVKEALVEVRRISMDLRPPMLDDLGLLPTLSWFFRELESACRGITVMKKIDIAESAIPVSLKTTIFRLLQEATNNIVKHAGANEIRIGLVHQANVLELTVADNGHGFDTGQSFKSDGTGRGLGLRSMKERARLSGGLYALESGAGQGTCIRITWPIVRPVSR
jgi:signal transduction histidine kinase